MEVSGGLPTLPSQVTPSALITFTSGSFIERGPIPLFFVDIFLVHIHNFLFYPFLLSFSWHTAHCVFWKERGSEWRLSELCACRGYQTAAFVRILEIRCKMDLLLSDLLGKLNVQPHKLCSLQAGQCCSVSLLVTQAYLQGSSFQTAFRGDSLLSSTPASSQAGEFMRS